MRSENEAEMKDLMVLREVRNLLLVTGVVVEPSD
jgi:hypothetical protein